MAKPLAHVHCSTAVYTLTVLMHVHAIARNIMVSSINSSINKAGLRALDISLQNTLTLEC